ncbi:hypothetical protein D3C76_1315720 [compost metagenome]
MQRKSWIDCVKLGIQNGLRSSLLQVTSSKWIMNGDMSQNNSSYMVKRRATILKNWKNWTIIRRQLKPSS